jgi:Leucine-rich repeat (LRR) protein
MATTKNISRQCSKLIKTLFFMKSKLLLLFSLFSFAYNAQNVTIPDANFALWLSNSSLFSSCIVGNQLDTVCVQTAIQNSTQVPTISANSAGISDLEGIQFFTGLEQLFLDYNNLTTLPNLPNSLKKLWVNDNQLTSLPSLPTNLESLSVETNNLTALPSLPNSLEQLWCSENMLTALPDFSQTQLYDLICMDNQITTFIGFPNTLHQLYASNNQITNIPAWGPEMRDVLLSENFLTSIPTLNDSMVHLNLAFNQITSLSYLPNSIKTLIINNNSISSLPNLPTSLTQFWCNDNQISNIPPLPQGLTDFSCENNLISCLPILPNSIVQLSFFGGNNNIICAPNYLSNLATTGVNNINLLALCDSNNTNGCANFNGIAGKIYNDANSNCVLDMGESLSPGTVLLQNGMGNTVTALHTTSGAFSFANLPNDTYTLSYAQGAGLQLTCPGNQSIVINHTGLLEIDNDFGIECDGSFDLSTFFVYTEGSPIPSFFPGEITNAYVVVGDVSSLNYGNMNCASGISGTVSITVDGPVTYLGPSQFSLIPSSIVGNTYNYIIPDFDNLNIYRDFGLQFSTDTTATNLDEVMFYISIVADQSESYIVNNSDSISLAVIKSYDPNMKEVFPRGDVTYPFMEELIYTIHFQNTGNAPALNIKLRDNLDPNLNLSTFRVLGASHSVETLISNNNVLFKFDNIYLMDSITDEPNSKGWVTYGIYPNSSLPIGTVIENFADIYFDFNAPITTNTTINTIVGPSSVEEYLNTVQIYPNPTSEFIYLEGVEPNSNISIYTLNGQELYSQNTSNEKMVINLSNYDNGVYLIQIQTDKTKQTYKFVKQK